MQIRNFVPDDAEFCCRLRNRAFRDLFQGELQPEEVAAAVRAYRPADYNRMAGRGALFIVEQNGRRVGFFYLRRIDPKTAELVLIYIDPHFHHRGVGSSCIRFIERWVPSNWKGVVTLIVDTVIPGYNAAFYQRVGFSPVGNTECELSGLPVKALRLAKRTGPPG